MTDNPTHPGDNGSESVTVELDRETANILEALPQVDLDIESESRSVSEGDDPQATLQSLCDLAESVRDIDAQRAIARSENQYVMHFIAMKCFRNLKSNSAEAYVSYLNEYVTLVPFGENVSFVNADWSDVSKYVQYLIDEGHRWKTFKGKINLLKRFYQHIEAEFSGSTALDMGYLRRLDPKDYDVEAAPIERKPLTREEIRKLVDALDSRRDRLIVRLIYQAALRNSEVRNLKIPHFNRDVDDPQIRIVDSKHGKSRSAPIKQELALDLEHWIDVQRPSFSPFAPESEYLFPSKRSPNLQSNQAVWKIVRDAADEVDLRHQIETRSDGVPKYRVDVHTLRHTGNTHWEKCGIDLEDRMEILGHEDEETTKNYSHASEESAFKEFRKQFDPAV